ncbi:MAG: hypothetical protein CL927_21085 [Deltaproteobacteria bacterium]|nr:hypothetical protein [Deltaproteobacteria bacterium]
MRRLGWPLALLLFPGCSSVSGKWLGSCDFGDARYGYTAAVTLDIEDGRGSAVEGKVQLDMFDGRSFEGKVDGLRSDTYIEMDGDFRQDDGVYSLSLTGDIDESVIEGDCSLKVPLGTGALTGDMILER